MNTRFELQFLVNLDSPENRQSIHRVNQLETRICPDHLVRENYAARVIYWPRSAGTTIVQRNNTINGHERTPRLPVSPQPVEAVVTIDKNEVGRSSFQRRVTAGGLDAGKSNPAHCSVSNFSYFLASNFPLSAEPETADGKRINSKKHTIRSHRCAQSASRHAMPHTDFNQTSPSACVTGEAIALGEAGLRLGSS
jgi:hypothetical protein